MDTIEILSTAAGGFVPPEVSFFHEKMIRMVTGPEQLLSADCGSDTVTVCGVVCAQKRPTSVTPAKKAVPKLVVDAAGVKVVGAIETIKPSKKDVSPSATQLKLSVTLVSPAGIVTSL